MVHVSEDDSINALSGNIRVLWLIERWLSINESRPELKHHTTINTFNWEVKDKKLEAAFFFLPIYEPGKLPKKQR